MDCKVTAFRTNSLHNAGFLIVKFTRNLHFVKTEAVSTFISLTFRTKILQFCYKSSEARKKIPSSFLKGEGHLPGQDLYLWMQRETKNQVGFLCTGVGNHLSEDGN